MIDMGHYRRFYRQKCTSFAGAGGEATCEGATFSTVLSTSLHLSAARIAREYLGFAIDA